MIALRQFWVGLFLAVTLVVAGVQFASHSVHADATDPEIAFVLAMGGTLDDLCLTDDGEAGHDHAECPFCRELEAFALQCQDYLPERVVQAGALDPDLSQSVVHIADHFLRPPSRAPPAA